MRFNKAFCVDEYKYTFCVFMIDIIQYLLIYVLIILYVQMLYKHKLCQSAVMSGRILKAKNTIIINKFIFMHFYYYLVIRYVSCYL